MEYSPKRVAEAEFFSVDYVNLLTKDEVITSANWSVKVLSGSDPSPQNIFDGTPIVQDSVVSIRIVGGVADTLYAITCTVQTNRAQVLVLPEPGRDLLLITN